MNMFNKSAAAKIMVFDSLGLVTENQIPTLLIDDFTLVQQVSDNGVDQTATSSRETLLAGTELNRAIRHVSALATGGIYEFETVIIEESFLKINNTGGSSGTCSIEYLFDKVNFLAISHGILLNGADIDFDIAINISINGGSVSSGFQTCTGDRFFQPYTGFVGDKSQLSQVTCLRLDFKTVQAHNVKSQITRLNDNRKIPSPAMLSLMGLGVVELGMFCQKEQHH